MQVFPNQPTFHPSTEHVFGSNIPSFSFASETFGNTFSKYLEVFSSLFKALTYCFLRSLICNGGRRKFHGSINGALIVIFVPGSKKVLLVTFFCYSGLKVIVCKPALRRYIIRYRIRSTGDRVINRRNNFSTQCWTTLVNHIRFTSCIVPKFWCLSSKSR